MNRAAPLWRIGVAGCSEGPFPLAEVFARLKERRWSGQIMVHARGVTDGWKPIEEVAEFAPLLKQLRGTYMGASSELQWRASVDASERGVEHTVWTPQEPDSSDSHPSNGPSWHSHAVDVQEDSFGFLSPSAPPPHRPSATQQESDVFLPVSSSTASPRGTQAMAIPPAPIPPPIALPVPPSAAECSTPAASIPFDASLRTRLITAAPTPMEELGIHVTEEGHDAFL